jgi:hypothetical protein
MLGSGLVNGLLLNRQMLKEEADDDDNLDDKEVLIRTCLKNNIFTKEHIAHLQETST